MVSEDTRDGPRKLKKVERTELKLEFAALYLPVKYPTTEKK